jgi:succinyl-diaminopimelate desuccinylase
VARREGVAPGPACTSTATIDVVLPGAGWTVDPWEGVVRDGRVYGRGSCDMKGRHRGQRGRGRIHRRRGLPFAARWRTAARWTRSPRFRRRGLAGPAGLVLAPRVHHVIIPEPLGVDRVCVGHAASGGPRSRPSGASRTARCPSSATARSTHGRVRGRARARPAAAAARALHVPAGRAAAGAPLDAERQLDPRRPDEPPAAPSAARDYLSQGPAPWWPIRAARCSTGVTWSRRPGRRAARGRGRARAPGRRAPGFRYAVREIMAFEPTHTPEGAPVVEATRTRSAACWARRAAGSPRPAPTTQKHIARSGRLRDCIAYGRRAGPGAQPDEWVGIDDMWRSAQVMRWRRCGCCARG